MKLILCIQPHFFLVINAIELNFQKFNSDSYCVDGEHRSARTIFYGDITTKGSKVMIGFCSNRNRKKSMTVSDNTIQSEGVSFFSKIWGRFHLIVAKI